MPHPIPTKGHQPFLHRLFSDLQTISAVIVWMMLGLGVLMIPVLVIFASPFLGMDGSTLYVGFLAREENPQQQRLTGENAYPSPAHPDINLPQFSAPGHLQPRQSLAHHSERFDSPIIHERGNEIHLLVDTSQHRLFVKQGERVLHMAIASIGSGAVLEDPKNPERVWTFETPKGNFRIQSKLEKPVWIRPDWAFIEQGTPIPDKESDRLMPGVFGPYALGFGDGYFIHGALYTNLLGQNVTHGCIQLHPEDLRYVFQTVPLGTPLIII